MNVHYTFYDLNIYIIYIYIDIIQTKNALPNVQKKQKIILKKLFSFVVWSTKKKIKLIYCYLIENLKNNIMNTIYTIKASINKKKKKPFTKFIQSRKVWK